MKLNLGCGQNKREGFVNIDKYATFEPDLVWDLEKTPYPFGAGSVTEIAATHVLEHLGQHTDTFLAIIKELYRVLAPGGKIDIKAPHPHSDGYWGDPTHVRPVTPQIMSLFSNKNCRRFAELGWLHPPLADYLDVDLEIESTSMVLMSPWAERHRAGHISQDEIDHALNSHWNVVDEITMVLRRV